jgi:hypothetical protein
MLTGHIPETNTIQDATEGDWGKHTITLILWFYTCSTYLYVMDISLFYNMQILVKWYIFS